MVRHSAKVFSRRTLVLLFIVIFCSAFNDMSRYGDPTRWRNAKHGSQPIMPLGPKSLPNTNVDIEDARRFHPPLDADSIELTFVGGSNRYHPVAMLHRCYHFLGAYLKTGDTVLLMRAEKYVAKLSSLTVRQDGAVFLQYQYDYRVHRDDGLKLRWPWVSGMAQGEFLGVVVRLFECTADSSYLELAHRVFRSLTRLQSACGFWVARIDSAGFFWIEEYPLPEPDQTLNGFVAAVYGVFDYLRVVKSDDARRMYDICLTTLKHYLPEYRRPDSLSYYCLGHRQAADSTYHGLHISMCRELFRMSGDSGFLESAREMNRDVRVTPAF